MVIPKYFAAGTLSSSIDDLHGLAIVQKNALVLSLDAPGTSIREPMNLHHSVRFSST